MSYVSSSRGHFRRYSSGVVFFRHAFRSGGSCAIGAVPAVPAPGEWWENPEWGFFVLEALQASRLTETETAAVSAQISAYIRETPGVPEVENVQFSVSGRQLSYACSVRTGEGSAQIRFETGI